MNYQLLAIYFISLCCISSAYEILKEIIRNTTNGQIRGIVVKSKYKAEVFFGVPYAEAPLGKLRFQVILCNLLFILHIINIDYSTRNRPRIGTRPEIVQNQRTCVINL